MNRLLAAALRRYAIPAALVLAVFVAGGCITRDEVYGDIYASRRSAYEAWKRAKEGENGGQIVLTGDLSMAAAVLFAVGNDEKLGNNKQLLATLAQKENAAGRVTEAYSAALPKLDLTERYSRVNRAVIGQRSNTTVDLELTQPIFRGGAISAGIRAAKLFTFFTDEQVAGAIQDVAFQARQGYLDALLGRELMKVSEGDLKLAQAHLDDVEKKKKAGVVSQYDVLRATVDVTNVEAQLIERQNTFHLAIPTLLKTLGVSQESRVELSDKLVYAQIAADLDTAVKQAFKERPEILQAELQMRLNREALVQARSGYSPRLDASLTQRYGKPDPANPAVNRWDETRTAALVLTWPLFDGLATYGRVQQAKADLKRSEIELADAEEKVLLDVKQALFNLEDAQKFVTSQSANLERAAEALRLAKAGYDAGVNTEIEMLDARQALSQTQALYYQAVYRHEAAKLQIERSTGALKGTGKSGGAGK